MYSMCVMLHYAMGGRERTLAMVTDPSLYLVESSSHTGARFLQWPHLQKGT